MNTSIPLPATEPRIVVPCATPYGTNVDGTPFEPKDWQPCESTYGDGSLHPYSKGSAHLNKATKNTAQSGRSVCHTVLPMCGHKFVPGHEPRMRNCESCWFAFFQVHGELTKAAAELVEEHGLSALIQVSNPKFAKNFVRFMATVARWKKELEAESITELKANNEQGIDRTRSTDDASDEEATITYPDERDERDEPAFA